MQLEQYETLVLFQFDYDGSINDIYYIVDYDDGSLVEKPKLLEDQRTFFMHLYLTTGIFNVNLTVLNQVDSSSTQIQVKVLNRFIDFKCVPNWRPIDKDGTIEYAYSFDEEIEAYPVSVDYDLRLHCTWKSNKAYF